MTTKGDADDRQAKVEAMLEMTVTIVPAARCASMI